MGDSVTCPDCGAEIESTDGLEAGPNVAEIEAGEDGSISVYRNRDLFLCKQCKNVVGVSPRQRD